MKETKYKNLVSPLKVGNLLLKNRFSVTLSNPHFVQGTESWPTEALISNYANKAKNGAAVVNVKANNATKNVLNEDTHVQGLNIHIPRNQHYFVQISDQIHYYGAKAQMMIMPSHELTEGYDASSGILSGFVAGDGSEQKAGQEAPRELLYDIIEAYGKEAKLARELGYDMCLLDMAYRFMFPARFLSPLTNFRTDEFGGSLENRARFPLLICEAIKSYAGKDFPIEIIVSGEEANKYPGGTTIEDTIEFARLGQGKFDILQPRAADIDFAGLPSVIPEQIPTLGMTRAITRGIKENDINILVTMVGGCHDPDVMDALVAEGACDIVGGARNWWADFEYGKKIYEGRGEDITPCIRCNKCHVPKPGHWLTCCSVNPVIGLEHKIDRMVTVPDRKKKIAVVGGGVAGMEAALVAQKRGHDVTLYEKTERLGGLLNCNDGMELKWTLINFRNYMVHQIEKSGISLKLNTLATPEMLKAEDYDDIILSVGSSPLIPPICGLQDVSYDTGVTAAKNEPLMGKRVTVIGGNDVGVEIGIHLAQKGHEVSVIEMRELLAADAPAVHFRSLLEERWTSMKNFHPFVNAVCTGVSPTNVTYKDAEGAEHTIECDHIVLAAGMKANVDEVFRFWDIGPNIHVVGDCDSVGSVQSAMRSAFAIASNL